MSTNRRKPSAECKRQRATAAVCATLVAGLAIAGFTHDSESSSVQTKAPEHEREITSNAHRDVRTARLPHGLILKGTNFRNAPGVLNDSSGENNTPCLTSDEEITFSEHSASKVYLHKDKDGPWLGIKLDAITGDAKDACEGAKDGMAWVATSRVMIQVPAETPNTAMLDGNIVESKSTSYIPYEQYADQR